MRLLSVALHEKAEAPALPRGSALQKAPRVGGLVLGRRHEGDRQNAEAEKAGPEDRAGLATALRAGTEPARRGFIYRVK